MSNDYFITPTHNIAINYRAASSSIVRAIILKYYPEIETKIQNARYPVGRNADNSKWHDICPQNSLSNDIDELDKQVLLVVRNPVDRFISAMAANSLSDVESVLYALESNSTIFLRNRDRNIYEHKHFLTQSRLLHKTTKCYLFDSHLEQFAAECGIDYPMLNIDEMEESSKPSLTQEQIDRVLSYYAEDKTLYDSITSPGTEITTQFEQNALARQFASIKSNAIAALETEKISLELQGVLVDCSAIDGVGEIVRMRTAQNAIANYNGIKSTMELFGEEMPYVQFWSADGNGYVVTQENYLSVLKAYASLTLSQLQTYYTKSAAIYGATTIEEIEAIG